MISIREHHRLQGAFVGPVATTRPDMRYSKGRVTPFGEIIGTPARRSSHDDVYTGARSI